MLCCNHRPIENISIVFADLDDEVPTGAIEILILSGEAKREGCVVARCLYLAVIEYLVVLIAPYLDAALSRIVLYEATADIGMLDILVARQCGYSCLVDYALNSQVDRVISLKRKLSLSQEAKEKRAVNATNVLMIFFITVLLKFLQIYLFLLNYTLRLFIFYFYLM